MKTTLACVRLDWLAAGKHSSRTWLGVATALLLAAPPVQSQVSISEGGTPTYSIPIAVPPGIAGMAPNIGLLYSGGGVNGPVGYGWSIQGISVITRCPNIKAVDGNVRGVDYSINDKLCLDGQRLIQTDATGATTGVVQTNDSQGGSGQVREYRTEKDTFARIRAYGMANNLAANGPAYFKVWTKSGQIYEYGNNANSTANAAIAITGKTAISAWAVSRISDTLGNYIDFQYEQRDMPWGSGPTSGSPLSGHEWNLLEIRYTGTPTQAPVNKVAFENLDRSNTVGAAQDSSEAYHQGAKNVSVRRLNAVRTYINITATPVKVKTTKITYDQGPITQRSRIFKIQECAGEAETQCLPATTFNYAPGGNEAYQANANFNLGTTVLQNSTGSYGVLSGNFLGSGRTDLIRWSDNPAQNVLYRSSINGSFSPVASGTGTAQFNITDQNLFRSDGCYFTYAVDLNGDGVTDLLRYSNQFTTDMVACASYGVNYAYISKGNGEFTRSQIPSSVVLERFKSVVSYPCNGIGGTKNPICIDGPVVKWTKGASFYLMDVNGDGRLDIITTKLPAGWETIDAGSGNRCAGISCTHVYLGDGNGGFVETPSNLLSETVYADPAKWGAIRSLRNMVDVNGDGMLDLQSVGNPATVDGIRNWVSLGDGNFSLSAVSPWLCGTPIDFNGDGRMDCLFIATSSVAPNRLYGSDGLTTAVPVALFNLTGTLNELATQLSSPTAGIGAEILDINGDGRSDILRWEDDSIKNKLYLSNGDGSFRESSSFNLKGTLALPNSFQLQKIDGSVSFLLGDFTGSGSTQILRLKTSPVAGEHTANQLYVKVDPTPPDQLLSVVSSTGLKTDLIWVPLTNSSSGTLGDRYTSDRSIGNPNAAVYPRIDLTVPMQVVATSISDSAVGTSRVTTEYSYTGLKATYDGRGIQGFRETRKQITGPNGQNLTVVTQYLQDHPYRGVASTTSTYLGNLNALSANPVSSSDYIYCESSSAATGTLGLPCPVAPATKVQRPYLYQSIDKARELNSAGSAVLPSVVSTVTTTNTFNGSGDPTAITVTTAGSVLGQAQSFGKTTTNSYRANDTAGDNWILGRLESATQRSTVVNILDGLTPSAGTAPLATATQGVAP
jgi:hypothetical protein